MSTRKIWNRSVLGHGSFGDVSLFTSVRNKALDSMYVHVYPVAFSYWYTYRIMVTRLL